MCVCVCVVIAMPLFVITVTHLAVQLNTYEINPANKATFCLHGCVFWDIPKTPKATTAALRALVCASIKIYFPAMAVDMAMCRIYVRLGHAKGTIHDPE